MGWPRFYRKKFLQRFSWTRALYFHQEIRTLFWDGRPRLAPRRIARLFSLWRGSEELRLESDLVFQAYREGDVIDVGAADGWYGALLAPREPSRILAFEPDPPFYKSCLESFAFLQGSFPQTIFTVLPLACGTGEPLAFTHKYGHLSCQAPNTKTQANFLPTLSLDDAVQTLKIRPGFLKIDVEGFEGAVLQGARETLARYRPVLLLEFHKFAEGFSSTRADAEKWLVGLGYRSNPFFESDLLVRCLFQPASS